MKRKREPKEYENELLDALNWGRKNRPGQFWATVVIVTIGITLTILSLVLLCQELSLIRQLLHQ